MKHLSVLLTIFIMITVVSCNSLNSASGSDHEKINGLFFNYYEARLKFYPIDATTNGDNRYNDLFLNTISQSHRNELRKFYRGYLDSLLLFDRAAMEYNDQISFDVLKWECEINLEGLKYHDELLPINQFWSLTLTMGQLGSGQGIQPFKTVKDYHDFLSRINGFSQWADTAVQNMRMGILKGYVLPAVLAERVIPQLSAMTIDDATSLIFYYPIQHFPTEFSGEEKSRLTEDYSRAIREKLIPSYQKLLDFFQKEYLPASRSTAGIASVPDGTDYYNYLIKQSTTTEMTADEIFELGNREVARIREEMGKIKEQVGYKGDLKSFFEYLYKDQQFFPFKTPQEVLDGYEVIHTKEMPQVNKMFSLQPKTKFEVRQTEAFRSASASAEYQQGSADGSRPGIFYAPILDATKYNATGMETLFLHEAIPGHHFQISLQQENESLPAFRKFIWFNAYGEGWALYSESLGEELGLYTDPYQKFGNLSDEMHRAIRLVVDVGLHVKGWTREQAIQFSLDNEAIDYAGAAAEIERYMAIPGQALSYKIGQLKILELRAKAQKELGDQFSYPEFHEVMLRNGCLPLAVLESDFNNWLKEKKEKR